MEVSKKGKRFVPKGHLKRILFRFSQNLLSNLWLHLCCLPPSDSKACIHVYYTVVFGTTRLEG